jgi:protein involved in polysaccharide export with SLBB domain
MMATLFHGEKPEPPPVTYTVTFNANGASGTPPEARTVNDGAVINLPDKGSMSSTGNIFAGWNESPSGGGTTYSVGASVTVTRNMVFYAQWLDGSTPQYTVTFNANGATGGAAPAPQTVYSGISITVPGQGTLAYNGKTFGGWNTQSNGGGTNYAVGAAFTVTGHVTLYAKWQSAVQYTVTYNANGASGSAPSAQTVDPGTEITIPGVGSMTNLGKTFEGWNTQANGGGTSYAEGAAYTVNTNVTLYAKWLSVPIEPPGATLVEKLAYIRSQAGDGILYDIVVNSNEYIGPQTVSTMGRNITVNIHSASPADVKTIQLEGQGSLFSVDTGITLKLQDIVLKGHSTNNKALVTVGQGTLILNSGTKITMNTNIGSEGGGGVCVNGGNLEINDDAEISVNTHKRYPAFGGGIYVGNRGSVFIKGGTITENTADADATGNRGGGGIYITGNSAVNMSGGVISKNKASEYWGGYGGGVFIDSGSSFIKRATQGGSSGIIYGYSGDNANITWSNRDNIAAGNGSAIYRNWGSLKQRNTTLGGYDEISTGNDEGWE